MADNVAKRQNVHDHIEGHGDAEELLSIRMAFHSRK
jgi:hypothetical protein